MKLTDEQHARSRDLFHHIVADHVVPWLDCHHAVMDGARNETDVVLAMNAHVQAVANLAINTYADEVETLHDYSKVRSFLKAVMELVDTYEKQNAGRMN